MATLIDTKYKIQGKTVLYVPNEGSVLTVVQAAQNKEYVQRLESMLYINLVIVVITNFSVKSNLRSAVVKFQLMIYIIIKLY